MNHATMNSFEFYVFKLFLAEKPRSKRGTFISRETRDCNLSFNYRVWLLRNILKGRKRGSLFYISVTAETCFIKLVSLFGRTNPGIFLRHRLDRGEESVVSFKWDDIFFDADYGTLEN